MAEELLTSKLFTPPLRRGLVARPRLVQMLDEGLEANRRLTLVSAPAGFGKTTLVVDWLRQRGFPAAWLSLDEGDNDPLRFLAYLAAAFQQVDERIGAPLLSGLQSLPVPPVEQIVTGLLNEVAARTEPIVLVLDDVHLVTDGAILQGLEFLLHHQPPPLHVVLTTREDPDLPLARLRARDQLTEIRARDLRFTQAETDAFLRGVMGLALSDQDVAALEGRTEGWAAGLQLAGLSMQGQADLKSFVAEFSGTHRHILDYLTDEVLQQQPEDIRDFLVQTSLLERLSGPLCDALTGRQDSDSILAQLAAANLFILPLDDERRWYRYHHLFSDLLRSQLTRTRPEMLPGLHRRASQWYEEHGEIQEAVDHALQEADPGRAAHLIEQHSLPRLYRGQIAMVVGWFDRLPPGVLESAPLLCIDKAWAFALMQRGVRMEEVDLALETAGQALDQVEAGEGLRRLVAGHTASIRAFLLRSPWTGETRERLIALSREAQQLLPVEENAIRSINELNIGYAYLGLADLQAASLAFRQAQEDGLAGRNYYAAIYGPINLILIALLEGRRGEALELCEASIERFNRMFAGQSFPPIGALYILKGSLLLEQDQLADARELAVEGLELVRWTGESVGHRTGYTTLARLHAIQGDQAGMRKAMLALEETLPREAFYAQALRHRLSLHHWPQDPQVKLEARAWLSRAGIEFGKLAVINSLNPASTAQFESHIHTAYVLAYLAKATPGAYFLGEAQVYLERQAQFAETKGLPGWAAAVALARTQLYDAEGKKAQALETLQAALQAAAPAGLLRVFVDECETLQPLLQALRPRLREPSLAAYADRLLEAFGQEASIPQLVEKREALLSGRELEVLQYLARGLSYEEIGQQLYLSLNTVQSHVKSIYRKLVVNKRVHAIEKARELKLI